MTRQNTRSLAKNPKKKSAGTDTVRSLTTAVQKNLEDGHFDEALTQARELEQNARPEGDEAAIYLTSMVWQIRALQGLKRDRDDIENAARHYAEEAEKLGDFRRVVQANRIAAQAYIDTGTWTVACEYLEKALSAAMAHQFGRETLELLMHLSALELKLCHYCEAIDYLSRAMQAITPNGAIREDFRDLGAIGYRQLCELYDTIGDGQNACDALEKAQSATTRDPEELWMQQLILARFDMRSGDADASCARLKKIESDVKKAVCDGHSRCEQLAMVQIEYAQALWNNGEYEIATQKLDAIGISEADHAMKTARALTKFQWAVEAGLPAMNPDEYSRIFSETCNEAENTDIQILLAAALTQASVEIERGHYDTTLESLLHIAQTAAFTQLIPFATRALALRGHIFHAQGSYSEAACDGRDACETFVDHVDDVCAKQAAALMLRAQIDLTQSQGNMTVDEGEIAAFEQLVNDLSRFEAHHHAAAFIDLGLELIQIAEKIGRIDTAKDILKRLDSWIVSPYMAHRAMVFMRLKARLTKDDTLLEKANEIARENAFV